MKYQKDTLWLATCTVTMKKYKKSNSPVNTDDCIKINGTTCRTDICAFTCDMLLLCVFLYNQIFYGMNMWFLILPLFLIGIYLAFSGFVPEKYFFTETSLEIRHGFYKVTDIPYEDVFNLEAKGKDNFINLLQENRVTVYYTAGKRKKASVCRPENIHVFEEELKKRCPVFNGNEQKSRLSVFFNEKQNEKEF